MQLSLIKSVLYLLLTSVLYISCNTPADRKKESAVDSVTHAAPAESGQYGGIYSFGEDVETESIGRVTIYPLNADSALFFLDVNRGAPSYNMGQLSGLIVMNGNKGVYDSKRYHLDFNCVLRFTFYPSKLEVETDENCSDCQFGYGVFADATYQLVTREVPDYIIGAEGDTVYIKDVQIDLYSQGHYE